MVNPSQSDRRDQSSTVRTLKLLVMVMVLSNVALGVFSFYLLRSMDRRYSDLIEHAVPLLSDLQEVTVKTTEAMRATDPMLFGTVAEQRDMAVGRARLRLESERLLREKVLGAEWPAALTAGKDELRQTGQEFTKRSAELVALYAAGNSADAGRLRETVLRPVFDRYIGQATKASDFVENNSLRLSGDYSAKIGSSANWILGLSSWPILVVIALLIATALFIGVLMIAFRGKDLSEAP